MLVERRASDFRVPPNFRTSERRDELWQVQLRRYNATQLNIAERFNALVRQAGTGIDLLGAAIKRNDSALLIAQRVTDLGKIIANLIRWQDEHKARLPPISDPRVARAVEKRRARRDAALDEVMSSDNDTKLKLIALCDSMARDIDLMRDLSVAQTGDQRWARTLGKGIQTNSDKIWEMLAPSNDPDGALAAIMLPAVMDYMAKVRALTDNLNNKETQNG